MLAERKRKTPRPPSPYKPRELCIATDMIVVLQEEIANMTQFLARDIIERVSAAIDRQTQAITQVLKVEREALGAKINTCHKEVKFI